MAHQRRRQTGFTLVEMIIATCIIAVLASVAIKEVREYERRAQVSEVIVAATDCKSIIGESYLTRDSAPDPGTWGCEVPTGKTRYAGYVQTSSNGVIRIAISNVARLSGHHVYVAPSRSGGGPMTTPTDLGQGVAAWVCGSDSGLVRASLPATCRADTTLFSTEDFN